jgi:hypothetical protein
LVTASSTSSFAALQDNVKSSPPVTPRPPSPFAATTGTSTALQGGSPSRESRPRGSIVSHSRKKSRQPKPAALTPSVTSGYLVDNASSSLPSPTSISREPSLVPSTHTEVQPPSMLSYVTDNTQVTAMTTATTRIRNRPLPTPTPTPSISTAITNAGDSSMLSNTGTVASTLPLINPAQRVAEEWDPDSIQALKARQHALLFPEESNTDSAPPSSSSNPPPPSSYGNSQQRQPSSRRQRPRIDVNPNQPRPPSAWPSAYPTDPPPRYSSAIK